MAETYFVISGSEDGDIGIEVRSRTEFAATLKDPDYGDEAERCLSAEELVENKDPMYWGGRYLIIKGKVVVPKAKEKVTEWEIE